MLHDIIILTTLDNNYYTSINLGSTIIIDFTFGYELFHFNDQ